MTHETVLLDQAVDALMVSPDGKYIDGTFGRGGHSRALLDKLGGAGHLLALDKDPEAVLHAAALLGDPRFEMVQAAFSRASELAGARGWLGKVNGILLDLGVSSPQLDNPARGFSFMRDGPLDMRMDPSVGVSAAEWLATAAETTIADVLYVHGEERFSRRIAAAIVAERAVRPINSTAALARIIATANPRWEKHKHPATRCFQAIRIHINGELDELKSVLDQALEILTIGGRLVVISFHSLEDRLVKQFIRRQFKGDPVPVSVPLRGDQINRRLEPIGKAIKPGDAEISANPRARSAVMRVATKLA